MKRIQSQRSMFLIKKKKTDWIITFGMEFYLNNVIVFGELF